MKITAIGSEVMDDVKNTRGVVWVEGDKILTYFQGDRYRLVKEAESEQEPPLGPPVWLEGNGVHEPIPLGHFWEVGEQNSGERSCEE